jgi:elongation factor P
MSLLSCFQWTVRRSLPTLGKRHYKLSVGSIKKGQVVQLKDKAWKVLARDHVSSGRGGAVVKVKK